jgi:hypothetical protein
MQGSQTMSARTTKIFNAQWLQQLHCHDLTHGSFHPNQRISGRRISFRQNAEMQINLQSHLLDKDFVSPRTRIVGIRH